MSETNGTGVDYPKITLGGVEYTIKFTRGAFVYRLSKAGLDMNQLGTDRSFSFMIDVLHALIVPGFDAETLADLVLSEGKAAEIGEAIRVALGKAFPPTQTTAAGTAEPKAAVM